MRLQYETDQYEITADYCMQLLHNCMRDCVRNRVIYNYILSTTDNLGFEDFSLVFLYDCIKAAFLSFTNQLKCLLFYLSKSR